MALKRAIIILHFFVGIGAVGGGAGALLDTSGELMGVPKEMIIKKLI